MCDIFHIARVSKMIFSYIEHLDPLFLQVQHIDVVGVVGVTTNQFDERATAKYFRKRCQK